MDKSLIPNGHYCYTWKETPSAQNNFVGKVNLCPYWKVKEVNGIEFPWCDYLNLGGTPGCGDWKGWTDYKKAVKGLTEHFGSEELRDKNLSLFLLFDQCKECGENENE